MQKIQEFYDDLATQYHVIFQDWEKGLTAQAQVLDQLLHRHAKRPTKKILDCAAGIGTQSLGLAEKGYQVWASDLSSEALARLQHEAQARHIKLPTQQADFRDLQSCFSAAEFDAVMACDNALPHLLTESDLHQALQEIHTVLQAGGLFLMSQRDYDQILKEKPQATLPTRSHGPAGQRVYFQLWHWDEHSYDLDFFILEEKADQWHTHHFQSRYRAWQRSEVSKIVTQAGFKTQRWLMPDESHYYQPILLAWKD